MIKNKIIVGTTSAMVIAGIISGTTLFASANTTQKNNVNKIPRYVMTSDRLDAQAKVLGYTQSELKNILKTTTLKQLVADKGFTKQDFQTKVRAEVTAELQSQGYQTTNLGNHMGNKKHHQKNQ